MRPTRLSPFGVPDRPKRQRRGWRRVSARTVALAGAALLAVGLLPAASNAVVTSTQTTFLSKVGPVSADDGFPTYYQDSNGMRLAHCLDNSPLCGAGEAPLPDPTQPISFPNNYPAESFYFNATAKMAIPTGGNALLVAAVEAGFSGGRPADGHQHVMGRIRLRIDINTPGHYTVTTPYGVDQFDVAVPGIRAINFTEDIGIADGVFDGVLDSRVDPFLTWDTGLITTPDGSQYVGNPGVQHAVTGSTFGTNFFRIEGPNIGGGGINTLQTNLFSIVGKVATNSGIDAGHPTYSRTTTDGGLVDVVANTDPGKAVKATLGGVAATTLRGGPDGHYVARLPFTGATPPSTITVENLSDVPHAVKHPAITDLVTITDATYDSDQKTLTITAASSDQAVPPVLTAEGYGALAPGTQTLSPAIVTETTGTATGSVVHATDDQQVATPALVGTVAVGTQTFTDVAAPPQDVVVTSAAGGRGTEPVKVIGSAFPSDPVSASAGPDQSVQQGQLVTLDGSNSLNFTSLSWVQISGPAVTLAGSDTATATFTAPSAVVTLGFRLTAQGPGGPSTDDVTVTVQDVTQSVANAGPDQTVLVGDTVVLDGTASVGAAIYSWMQISGTGVVLNGADTARPTFVMPATTVPLIFELDTIGPGGIGTDTVTVTAVPDNLTVTLAQYRTGTAQWLITGTSSITNNNTITVHRGSTVNGIVIGAAQVDPTTGTWSVRVRNSPVLPQGTTVTVQSSRGGLLIGVFFTVTT